MQVSRGQDALLRYCMAPNYRDRPLSLDVALALGGTGAASYLTPTEIMSRQNAFFEKAATFLTHEQGSGAGTVAAAVPSPPPTVEASMEPREVGAVLCGRHQEARVMTRAGKYSSMNARGDLSRCAAA